jgi:hypothetical protein
MSDFFSEQEKKKHAKDKKIEKRIAWGVVIVFSVIVIVGFIKVVG